MIFYDADNPTPNVMPVRMFLHERGGLDVETRVVRLAALENRMREYRKTVNARGEVPALRSKDGHVVTESIAICEYLDEVASGGRSLVGETAGERATVRMWTRRVDLEIAQPVVAWWRGSADAEDLYMGFRTLAPEGQRYHRLLADQGMNRLNEEIEGRDYICGDRMMLADIILFSCMFTMSFTGSWINNPNRIHLAAWFARMHSSASARAALESVADST
ncbi:glutathione S-transferase family protein [Pelagovum pacificum]|nr:glutathione S-transferase family protein [Pelagovum pacificum]QQA44300.1 glutathione S-transferase family protein [Pelagovum pacificum]